jgi:hypothetical protein
MLTAELALFKQNIASARDMVATANALKGVVTAVIGTDDLLRSALVQAVSAFDHFIHEEVRSRMILTQLGSHPRAKAFDRFKVSLASVEGALGRDGVGWLEQEIREQHGYLSFQHPDKVADAIRLVSDVQLWPEIGRHLGRPPEDVKRELKLVVDRRNKIAHEADTDPTPPRARYPINSGQVTRSIDFLDNLSDSVVAVT